MMARDHRNPPVVPGYELEYRLTSGGSGAEVYVGRPDRRKSKELSSGSRRAPERVVIKYFHVPSQEMLAVEAAKHVGAVLDAHVNEEAPHHWWVVMPFYDGRTFWEVIHAVHATRLGQLDGHAVRNLLAVVCDVLDDADGLHRKEFWHRDIKPENIIVHGNQSALVDFGQLGFLGTNRARISGTEGYQDPLLLHRARRGEPLTASEARRFDLYAVGATLYHALTGSPPSLDYLELDDHYGYALQWVVRRACFGDHDDRYATTDEMRKDLEALRQADDPFNVPISDLPSEDGAVEKARSLTPARDQDFPRTPAEVALGRATVRRPFKTRPWVRRIGVAAALLAIFVPAIALSITDGNLSKAAPSQEPVATERSLYPDQAAFAAVLDAAESRIPLLDQDAYRVLWIPRMRSDARPEILDTASAIQETGEWQIDGLDNESEAGLAVLQLMQAREAGEPVPDFIEQGRKILEEGGYMAAFVYEPVPDPEEAVVGITLLPVDTDPGSEAYRQLATPLWRAICRAFPELR